MLKSCQFAPVLRGLTSNIDWVDLPQNHDDSLLQVFCTGAKVDQEFQIRKMNQQYSYVKKKRNRNWHQMFR